MCIGTISLAEDSVPDAELFRMSLQENGVECGIVLFEDGRAIIDRIRKADSALPASLPDLIVLDLNVPKSDGLEILQVIRDTPGFANLPVSGTQLVLFHAGTRRAGRLSHSRIHRETA